MAVLNEQGLSKCKLNPFVPSRNLSEVSSGVTRTAQKVINVSQAAHWTGKSELDHNFYCSPNSSCFCSFHEGSRPQLPYLGKRQRDNLGSYLAISYSSSLSTPPLKSYSVNRFPKPSSLPLPEWVIHFGQSRLVWNPISSLVERPLKAPNPTALQPDFLACSPWPHLTSPIWAHNCKHSNPLPAICCSLSEGQARDRSAPWQSEGEVILPVYHQE